MAARPATAVRLALAAVALGLLAACASTPPSRPDDICAIFEEKSDWFNDAVQAEERWGVPIPVKMAIMRHESAYRHNAKAPRRYVLGFIPWGRQSSAFGYAQAIDGTWAHYQTDVGRSYAYRDRFDDAVDFIGWYLATSKKQNGISHLDVYSHYLAYHEGHSGFRKGSFQGKPRLLRYAREVEQTAARYRQQFAACRADLERPRRWWWPFS